MNGRQWLRNAQLIVGNATEKMMVTELRIVFDVEKTIDATPNKAVIKVFNLAPGSVARIKGEYRDVTLNAGYGDDVSLVFKGNIKHVYHYKEGNDRITEIEAGDGDEDYKRATVNETVSGVGIKDAALKAALTLTKTAPGAIDIPNKPLIRGVVMSGNTRDVLDSIAKTAGAHWSIQNGRLEIVAIEKVKPGSVIVINADTGMVGTPEINDKGVAVKCLMNPRIAINGAVKLDNDSIKALRREAGTLANDRELEEAEPVTPVALSSDGVYKVVKVKHGGDTHGGEWVSEIECVAFKR